MKTKTLLTGMALAGALLVSVSVSKASIVLQIGTGLDASGNLIAPGGVEQNYNAITGPDGESIAVAYVQPFYAGAWIPNQPTGQ